MSEKRLTSQTMIRFKELSIHELFHHGNDIYRKAEPFFSDGCCTAEWNAVNIFTGDKMLCGHLMLVEPYWDGEQEADYSI